MSGPGYLRELGHAQRDAQEIAALLVRPGDRTTTELMAAIGLATTARDALLRAAAARETPWPHNTRGYAGMLTSSAVQAIMADCLFQSDELPPTGNGPPENAVIVDGLVHKFVLHPDRLASHKQEIADLLGELPDQFQPAPAGGGGWTFLNACLDRGGRQWGEHRDMEALFCLGIATGQAAWMMREMADVMPGGVPYVVVLKARP